MTLDKVLTLAIGRNGADGELSAEDWQRFQSSAKEVIAKHAVIVAATSGAGVGSDGERDGVAEDTAVIVAINPRNARQLRRDLAALLKEFKQSSAAFALDAAHEPVFSTASGWRAS